MCTTSDPCTTHVCESQLIRSRVRRLVSAELCGAVPPRVLTSSFDSPSPCALVHGAEAAVASPAYRPPDPRQTSRRTSYCAAPGLFPWFVIRCLHPQGEPPGPIFWLAPSVHSTKQRQSFVLTRRVRSGEIESIAPPEEPNSVCPWSVRQKKNGAVTKVPTPT